MTKQKSIPEYVTREILKEEISVSERRLDSKIENTSQSLRDYTDSRFTQLDAKIDGVEKSVKEQGKKMDVYFHGIVKMVESVVGKVSIADGRLKDHEKRITVLEGRGPQASRI